ncbi:hypothetical protein BH09MYX1_BH09MYX1_30820 [soil metagenome]
MDPELAEGLELGKLIDGRYRLDRVAGQGAFGVVYEAHHIALDTRVAVKVMRGGDTSEGLAPRPDKVAQFLSEARTSSSLRHPAIVRVLDAGVVDGKPYFVMEWCDGPTLKSVIAERGAMTVTAAWALLEPVFEAIAFAHAKGVVHRDIKPSNVVTFEGSARVIDFGIAKLIARDDTPGMGNTTTHGPSLFTPSYASPEQLAGARTGPWTDVYALALLFLEVVMGSAPGPTPRGFGDDVAPLEPVLARALAARPADRFPNAGELTTAVRQALEEPARRRRRRGRWLLAAIPALVIGSLVVAHVSRSSVAEGGRHDVAADSVVVAPSSTEPGATGATPSAVALPSSSVGATRVIDATVAVTGVAGQKPSASASPAAPSPPSIGFEVNGYENGGFIRTSPVAVIMRTAPSTKSCFPEPKADEFWSVYVVFLWPKGKPRESRIEVKRSAERILTDLGNGQRIGDRNATAEQIAACVRAKFDQASIPDADGQDDLDGAASYEKIEMGYFKK